MFVKFMKNDGLADTDYGKSYTMIEVLSIEFVTWEKDEYLPSSGWMARYNTKDGKCDMWPVSGNVYIMNDEGKTVDSFWPNSQ